MLRKHNNYRSLKDNIQLGGLTAFSAGMVNVTSVIIFFAFTSNVTGHYAIMAEEIAKGNWHEALIVFGWIFMFFFGNFTSNYIVINFDRKNRYLAHSLPLFIEILCLFAVGTYGYLYYAETLAETELMVAIMLFAMGIQNGLTASISNFAVKTTHLTGLTTDIGLLASMFTQKRFRENKALRAKKNILLTIATAYLSGGIFAGLIYLKIGFLVFHVACLVIGLIIAYEYYKLKVKRLIRKRKQVQLNFRTIASE
ncbi:YoaK family protein [Salegentibacter sp. HM20]